jgi:hypothetical protein
MDVVFSKKQLNLLKKLNEDDNFGMSVANSEGDGDPSSVRKDAEMVAQKDPNGNNEIVQTQTYTNKQIPSANRNQKMVFNAGNGSVGQAASQIQQFISTTNPSNLPGQFVIQRKQGINSSREIDKNLVEVTTFKKKDLDKFLKSL